MADLVVTLSGNDAALYRSMQRIIEQQGKLDDGYKRNKDTSKEAADAAKKANDDHALSLENVATAITATAGAYVGIQAGVQAVISTIDDMIAKQHESYDLAIATARFQQESAKNLTGLTSAEISQALVVDTPRIAREQGFSDIGKISEAIGAGYSASGDLKATLSAVESAAALTRLTADQLPIVAAGALDVARGSGTQNAQENLSFLLSAGKSARIEDPAKLAGTLAPVVSSGVATVPTQDKKTAAIEIASLFTALNQAATDKSGDSTRTATTTLLAKLDAFFQQQENDPGTISGRIAALQQNADLRTEFFKNPFGEVAFQKAFTQLADSSSDIAKSMAQAATEINFSTDTYTQKVKELETITPQITIASAVAKVDASVNANKLDDVRSASREAVAQLTDKALNETNAGGLVDFIGRSFESMFANVGLNADRARLFTSDKDLLTGSVQSLELRRQRLEEETRTPDIERKLALLEKTIEQILVVAKGLQDVEDASAGIAKNFKAGSEAAKNLAKQRSAAGASGE
jgi:hypothetical protein